MYASLKATFARGEARGVPRQVPAGEVDLRPGHVHPEHAAARPDELGEHVDVAAGPAVEVEDRRAIERLEDLDTAWRKDGASAHRRVFLSAPATGRHPSNAATVADSEWAGSTTVK
jgi:hypothetical protein